MSLLKLIFWCFVVYCLYRFVFELVLPVSKTVSKMKKTVQQMQENQDFKQHEAQSQAKKEAPQNATTTNTNDEYIEFEEVK